MSPSAKYYLFLYSPAQELNVGILKQDQPDAQLVRLQADLVEWVATPPIGGGDHGTVLGVGPYRYTTDSRGAIVATNVGEEREWFLTPGIHPNTYLIGEKLGGSTVVWTAGEPGEPITLWPIKDGQENQTFQFAPINNE
ncbi:hypothetical protein HD554DRAFT_2177606 [Boletus coccyginus]|nr:hypothetical protein HD554DRAFT_2177606 [Boletus coccyginus]